MEQAKKKALDYIGRIMRRKRTIVFGAVTFMILFSLSIYYMYDGLNKKFVIYTALSLITGLLIALPRIQNWVVNFIMLALYLSLVPGKIFDRMELPLTDMSEIQPGVLFASIMLIWFIFTVALLLFQRIRYALFGGNIFLLLFFLINYYVFKFRGSTFGINDLLATQTGLSVLKNYSLTIEYEQWYSILYFIFFAVLGSWIDFPWKGKKYHLGVTFSSIVFLVFSIYFWNGSGYYEKHQFQGYYWNTTYNERCNGALLSFLVSVRENRMEKPMSYSKKRLLEIADEIEEREVASSSSVQSPNIIMIMNEAWSDLRVLGDIQVNQDFMPYVDGMNENVLKGDLYVEILGGLTANTEYEALTGDSLALLSPTVVPYLVQVNHDVAAISELLNEQGYQTMAMHPNGPGAWNRDNVYRYFGFDDFIDVDKFQTEYSYVGNFISDECNFDEIIYQYEHRNQDRPFFLFDVTIQNHADYYDQTPLEVRVEQVAGSSELNYPTREVDTYLSLMKITDGAFQKLVEYFDSVEEPVIICMFGDHQPHLSDGFYDAVYVDRNLSEEEKNQLKYITKYVVWANYDVDWKEYGDVSANYLRSMVLDCAGVELSTYDKFLLGLMREYPVITHFTIDGVDQEAREKYQMLQYNHLIDRDSIKELFVK